MVATCLQSMLTCLDKHNILINFGVLSGEAGVSLPLPLSAYGEICCDSRVLYVA